MTAPAKTTFSFRSTFARMGQMPRFTQAQIAAERALRFAPISWAREHAGPIVRAFLAALPEEILASESMVVRAKPSFLREGWSGGGVAWHLDSVWGNFEDWSTRHTGFFRACVQLGGISATRIIEGVAEFPLYEPGAAEGRRWHDHVEDQLAAGRLRQTVTREGEIFMLNAESIHTVSAAEHDGHRIFLDVNDSALWSHIRPLAESYDEVSNSYYARSTEERRALAAAYGASYAD